MFNAIPSATSSHIQNCFLILAKLYVDHICIRIKSTFHTVQYFTYNLVDKGEHRSDIQIFESICDLICMLRILNFSICVAPDNTDIRITGYPENM